MNDMCNQSLASIRLRLAASQVRVEEVVRCCLECMDSLDPAINAFITRMDDKAIAQARAMDKTGPPPDVLQAKPLWGVPVALKDVLSTKGVRTTCGSKMLAEYVPCYDAMVVEKLKDAGAVILGKVNMDEFAMGSSTENSAFGPTRNPWNLEKVPGGSSGGSAASVAARMAFAALGTDTGGSIRQPASFCGLVGLKPTYGRVSRYGLVAYASSLDQVGPMTRTVEDTSLVLKIIAGHDPRDSTSVKMPVPDYPALLKEKSDLSGLKIGLPREYWGEGVDPEVEAVCRGAVTMAENLGAECVPVSLPYTSSAIAVYYIVATAEASSNLARFDGIRYGHRDRQARELVEMYRASRSQGFGEEVQRRIMLGTFALSSGYYDAYYRKAAQVRRLIQQDFLRAFETCDILCSPVSPTTAFGLGEKVNDPLTMYLSDIFTISLNLAGLPGLTLPVGLARDLPVGLQMIGPGFRESLLLQAAYVLEGKIPNLPMPWGLEKKGIHEHRRGGQRRPR